MEASREAYYLWAGRCTAEVPWARAYLNQDFLASESRRLLQVGSWYEAFTRLPENSQLQPVTLYVVDVDMPSAWSAAFAHFPDYVPVGLSALPNSSNSCLIGLFHRAKVPPLYRPIHVEISRKFIYHTAEAVPRSEYVLLVEAWAPERHASLYLDFPKSYSRPAEFLQEELTGGSGQLAKSIEAPLLSSPSTTRVGGGVSLSAFESKSKFSRAFQRSVQSLLPPHLRSVSAPRKAREGNREPNASGIVYRVAEKWGRQVNRVQSVLAREFEMISNAHAERTTATGEISFVSTLTTPVDQAPEVWNLFLKQFSVSELTLPAPLIELLEGIDLERFEQQVPEEMYTHVVESRHVNPRSENGFRRASEAVHLTIRSDLDALLADRRVGWAGDMELDQLSAAVSANVYRLAQAEARAGLSHVVDDTHIRRARDTVLDYFGKLVNRPDVRGFQVAAKRASKNPRERAVQLTLTYNGPSSMLEIWESLQSEDVFGTIEELGLCLDMLRERGRVILHPRQGFIWVGSTQ